MSGGVTEPSHSFGQRRRPPVPPLSDGAPGMFEKLRLALYAILSQMGTLTAGCRRLDAR